MVTFLGPKSEQKLQKIKVAIKHAFLAPTWTRIGVPCIVFCGESDGDTFLGPKSEQKQQQIKMAIKQTLLAQIWTRTGLS